MQRVAKEQLLKIPKHRVQITRIEEKKITAIYILLRNQGCTQSLYIYREKRCEILIKNSSCAYK